MHMVLRGLSVGSYKFKTQTRFSYMLLLVQNGLDTKVEKSRKQLKERKNRAKKIRGVKKVRNIVFLFMLVSSSGTQFSSLP